MAAEHVMGLCGVWVAGWLLVLVFAAHSPVLLLCLCVSGCVASLHTVCALFPAYLLFSPFAASAVVVFPLRAASIC